ncbi:MAG: tetratricopeptide repeat protein [Myxococcota bacterium]|jgi:hypothetical protein|nr:tetratricopeptide repeat protein [Myxococcota bacterium]
MSDIRSQSDLFATVSMAEILLAQNLVDQARRVLFHLPSEHEVEPRIAALRERLAEIGTRHTLDQVPQPSQGRDRVAVEFTNRTMRIDFEVTDEGVALARRKTRFAGRSVLRLFTAHIGPRGVRTTTRDIDLQMPSARLELLGTPRPAVHVAAVGYLAHTGEFVPLSSSSPLPVAK